VTESGLIEYTLPFESSKHFKPLFEQIDSQKDHLNISSYELRVTNLDEVFTTIGHKADEKDEKELENKLVKAPSVRSVESGPLNPSEYLLPSVPFCSKLYVLFLRRFRMFFRDSKTLFLGLVLPIIYLGLGFYMGTVNFTSVGPTRWFDAPSLFPTPVEVHMNTQPIQGGVSVPDFVSPFLGKDEFSIAYNDLTYDQTFLQAILEQQVDYIDKNRGGTTRYGSYYFYNLDDSSGVYQSVVFTNLTSQDAAPAFGNYVLQNAIRHVCGNPDFKFATAS